MLRLPDETEEEVQETVEAEFNVEEDVNALFSGEELSEEFQDKARTIFETAIKSKVEEVKEQIQVQYQAQLVEEVAAVKTELTERVDSYLEYVAQEWLEEKPTCNRARSQDRDDRIIPNWNEESF